jgi:hypothetical protein
MKRLIAILIATTITSFAAFDEGSPVSGKPGYVTSPYAPYSGQVDVRGFSPDSAVKCPYTNKLFLVPAASTASTVSTSETSEVSTPTEEPSAAKGFVLLAILAFGYFFRQLSQACVTTTTLAQSCWPIFSLDGRCLVGRFRSSGHQQTPRQRGMNEPTNARNAFGRLRKNLRNCNNP